MKKRYVLLIATVAVVAVMLINIPIIARLSDKISHMTQNYVWDVSEQSHKIIEERINAPQEPIAELSAKDQGDIFTNEVFGGAGITLTISADNKIISEPADPNPIQAQIIEWLRGEGSDRLQNIAREIDNIGRDISITADMNGEQIIIACRGMNGSNLKSVTVVPKWYIES